MSAENRLRVLSFIHRFRAALLKGQHWGGVGCGGWGGVGGVGYYEKKGEHHSREAGKNFA